MVSEFKGFKIRMLKGFKSECVMPKWALEKKKEAFVWGYVSK